MGDRTIEQGAQDFGGGEGVRFTCEGAVGVVTLCRPDALNALSHEMIGALTRALLVWADDPAISAVLVEGEGRAFCAGEDLIEIYRESRAGRPPVSYFADEYRLGALISRYPKPVISFVDGIVMGGGVGLAFHGSHRVMTENGVFAMPQVGVGFFPDVGGTCILSGVKGSFGMYLALTGERTRWGDALWTQLATHAVLQEDLPELREALIATADPDQALRAVAMVPPRETDDAALHLIATHFSRDTLDHVLASLRQAAARGDEFSRRTLRVILSRSPTSVAVTFAQITAGTMLTVEEALRMEFRILNRMLEGHDFFEGIRATLIKRDRHPRWKPARMEDVDPLAVEAHFASLGERELVLWGERR
ncbi:MAG: 3-hydroxyisobutyryl-CoA hydrolase [Mesorhizobium amorphae]|nr:MAG: 3-hydroxyisobutyryl-CoA hydrolase [Mesorhizobium amorphae]